MTDKQRILTALINESRFLQTGIRDGMDAAAGTSLRSMLALMLRDLDANEWEAYTIADSLGLHVDGLPPLSHLLSNGLCRIKFHFRNSDSCVAEVLIQNVTKAMIRIQKAVNQANEPAEPGTELLIHRFLGNIYGSIRNLQTFL